MNDQIAVRLKNLNAEYEAGQKMLADLEVQQGDLRATLLRIEGAMLVLRELLGESQSEGQDGSQPVEERTIST